jgi:hypothetical protein
MKLEVYENKDKAALCSRESSSTDAPLLSTAMLAVKEAQFAPILQHPSLGLFY